MESEKILEILEKSKGYDVALMTTFNFEVDFFEKAILSRLLKNNIKKVSVFVDSKELAKAVAFAGYSALGRRYSINPVSIHGSFHPKIILLLGEKKARLIIGSANLKLSGYYINNEVFNCIDYNQEQQEFRDIICSAISFFCTLNLDQEHTYHLDDNLMSIIDKYRYFRPASDNGKVFLLHNLNQSVLDQLLALIKDPVSEIHIAVPYYDNDLSAFHALQKCFINAEFHLYLQHRKSTFPETLFVEENRDRKMKIFEKLLVSGKENDRFYHGKVFLFKTDSASYVLYGSSNCTQSALTRTIQDGNVECNLLVKSHLDGGDSFFDGFIASDSDKVESHLMTFETKAKDNFYYLYGEADDVIKLHIGYGKKPQAVQFFYDGMLLEYYEEDGHIVIELEGSESTVFSIQAEYEGKKETLCCWYNDYKALKLFRIDLSDEIALIDKEDYATGHKFKEEYEKLLQAEMACVEDVDEWERINRSVTQPSGGIENDAVDPDEEDDFIVYVDVKDEDFASYQRYKTVEHIRGRIKTRFLKNLTIPLYYRGASVNHYTLTVEIDHDGVVQRRPATSEEKRFERFIKRKVKNYVNDDKKADSEKKRFIDRLSYDHYFGIVTTLFEIIQKNRDKDELIEDIFVDTYVIPTRISLLTALIDKYDSTKESSEDLIKLTFATILDNHTRIEESLEQNERGAFEVQNRKLLMTLENKVPLRSCYDHYLLKLENGAFTKEAQEAFDGAQKYIESLYGYKDSNQIIKYLKETYGESSKLDINNKMAKVLVCIANPGSLMRPDDTLLRELSKYSQNVHRIATVKITVSSTDNSKIDKIEHVINMEYRKLTTTVVWKNGMSSTGKPQYYNF